MPGLSPSSWSSLSLRAFLLLAALLSVPMAAEEAGETGEPMWVIRADRMLDVVSGEMVQDAVVVVRGEKIESLGAKGVPEGTPIIDLGDHTLLPGLMDLHTHLTGDLEGDWVHRAVQETAAEAALRGARNARRTLEAGFTTVRNLGSGGFSGVALARAVEQGLIVGPRIVPAAHSLGITGGHCDTTGYAPGIAERGPEHGVADGADELLKAARYQIKHGAQVIKICATAGVLSFEGPVGAQQFSEDELAAVVQEARRHGMKVAAHAHGAEGILAAVRAGVASIEHGSVLTDEILQEMKQQGTYLVPTTYLADAIDLDILPPPVRAKAEWILPRAKDSLRRAIEAGVKIAYGTDAGVYPHGLNARELASLVDRGMSPLEALRTATVHAADLLGVEDRGVIEAGRLADLIAVPGNPLEDITVVQDVRFVLRGGEVVVEP